MDELEPGLWHWTARHPEWTDADDAADHGWGPDVSCYAVAAGEQLVLIDPVIPTGGLDALRAGRETVVVLTCPWHAREAPALGLPLYAPPPDADDDDPLSANRYAAGDTLPFGITAFPGLEPNDLVLWVEAHRALVFGDTLIDTGTGLELPDDWGPSGIAHPPVIASLRERLALDIEWALPTHGAPADRAAFERALG
jgi:glyoxylase-like metal-dependent hydrolase (beta-lactamase superfamily II)